MKYFIKNNENLIGLLPELYAGIKLLEGQSLHEIPGADEARLLPEAYYNNKPEYIANVREFSFDFVPGTYDKISDFYGECAFVGENAFVNISRVHSKHYVASMPGDNFNDLTIADVANIVIDERPQEVDATYAGDIAVIIDGNNYTAHFDAGVASIAISMPSNNITDLHIDGKAKIIPVSFPASIIAMRNLRNERNAKLAVCDKVVIRHMTQLTKTLTDEQYLALQNYMQALRDLPATADLNNIVWPTKPSFI